MCAAGLAPAIRSSTSAADGARLPILARSPGGDWYQVQIEGRAEPAWVFAR
jgi:hypothetical protein